jgi:hypothetical protein
MNYLFYAPQLALIPVFIRLGEKMAGAKPIQIDLAVMKDLFMQDPGQFLRDFGMAGVHGILAWAVLLPIPTWLAVQVLTRQFRRVQSLRSDSSKA